MIQIMFGKYIGSFCADVPNVELDRILIMDRIPAPEGISMSLCKLDEKTNQILMNDSYVETIKKIAKVEKEYRKKYGIEIKEVGKELVYSTKAGDIKI